MKDIRPGFPEFGWLRSIEAQQIQAVVHEQHGSNEHPAASHERGRCRAIKPHRRDGANPEDQNRIENNVRNRRDDHQHAGQSCIACRAHAAHANHADDHERNARIKNCHVPRDQRDHVFRCPHQSEQRADRGQTNSTYDRGDGKGQYQAVGGETPGTTMIMSANGPGYD